MSIEDARYRLALEEARASVAEQSRSVEAVRGRAGTLLATGCVVAGLLAGRVFASGGGVNVHIGIAGWVGGAAATVGFICVLSITTIIWWPWGGWIFVRSASTLVHRYIEIQEPASLDEMNRALALHIEDHYTKNNHKLNLMLQGFAIGCLALGVEVLGFVVLAIDSR
jgi:hypothetical protein